MYNLKRLNITLPEKVAEALEAYENKSRFISEAVIEKIIKDKKVETDSLLIEGYKNENSKDKKVNEEWERATLESWPE